MTPQPDIPTKKRGLAGLNQMLHEPALQSFKDAKQEMRENKEKRRPKQEAKAQARRERGKPIAKFSPGLTSIKLYADGRIESSMHGGGSIKGATARVDISGSKRIFRDTRQSFLTIEGPEISIAAKIDSNGALIQKTARKFAADVNRVAANLGPVAAPTTAADQVDVLTKLSALRDSGVLTDEEFDAKKAEILAAK